MSILDKLAEESIIGFDLTPNKKRINVYEMCDYYFDCVLNKTEMRQLIAELQALEAQMIEE